MTDSHADRDGLLRFARELIDELDRLHQRLVRLDQLAGALLDEGDAAIPDEPSRRALLALRGVAEAYARAHDAAQRDAGDVRGGLGRAGRPRES